jgi:hypothetical protein
MFNLIGKIIITFYVFSLLFNLPSAFAQTRAGIVDTVWGNRLIRFQRVLAFFHMNLMFKHWPKRNPCRLRGHSFSKSDFATAGSSGSAVQTEGMEVQ